MGVGHFPCAQKVKNLPSTKEKQVQYPGRDDPLEKGMDIDKEPQGQSSLVGYSP